MVSRKKILVVEDNVLNRSLLCQILAGQYDVLEAGDGQEALNILKQYGEKISLIMLDIIMPVMDGYTFLSIVKADPAYSSIPVIVTTQSDGESDEVAALSHGAADFVAKPYKPKIILHRVASIINLRETAAMINLFQYDRLTGLYSKEFFYQRVKEMLLQHPDREYDIICSDIENFKLINDIFGIPAGDRLLCEVASMYMEEVGDNGICGRINADQFACMLAHRPEYSDPLFTAASTRINAVFHKIFNANNIVMKWGIYTVKDAAASVEQMCDRALLAARSIKGQYGKHFAFYDDELRSRLLREQAITDTMESALAKGQFEVYLQPKYSLEDGTLAGAEALVRWNHPEWGLQSPAEFIPLFEKNGFITELDQFVWDRTCAILEKWDELGYDPIPVSVNVSRSDVYQADLDEILVKTVQRHNLPFSRLHLEITESAYTEDPKQIIDTVVRLRELGFVIEMDDFGSGYSSLNMLNEMPIDVLKLDMKFVRTETEKPVSHGILRFIMDLARWMNVSVVAEGVETVEQLEGLRSIGCDYAQGYYFSKPVPCAQFEALMKDRGAAALKAGSVKDASGRKQRVQSSGDAMETAQEFCDAWFTKGDLDTTLSYVTEDIRFVGTGYSEHAYGYREMEAYLRKDIGEISEPFDMQISAVHQQKLAADACAIDMELTLKNSSYAWQLRFFFILTVCEGRWLIRSFHAAEPGSSQRGEEHYPKTLVMQSMQKQRQKLLNDSIAGGMMGGYMEPGFPFYFINRWMLDYLGYESEEEFTEDIGGLISNCMHPDDRDAVDESVNHQLEQKGEYTVDYRMKKRDGSYIWVHDMGRLLTAEDGRTVIVSVCIDITKQMVAQEEVLHIYNNIPGAVFLCRFDEDFSVIDANDGLFEFVGYTREEFAAMGNKMSAIIYPEDLKIMADKLAAQLSHGSRIHNENRLICKDKTVKWISINAQLFTESDGQQYFYCVFVDITEEKQLQEWMKELYEKELTYFAELSSSDGSVQGIVNITQDRMESYLTTSDMAISGTGDTYRQMIENLAYCAVDASYGEEIRRTLDRDAVMAGYAAGKSDYHFEFLRKRSKGGVFWANTSFRCCLRPDTGDIIGFFYTLDVTEQKLQEQLLSQIAKLEYDNITEVNLKKGTYHIFSRQDAEGNQQPASGEFWEEVRALAERMMEEPSRKEYLEKLDYRYMQEQLDRQNAYTFIVEMKDDKNELRVKRFHVFSISRELDRVCVARTDVTDVVRQEQRQKEELASALVAAEQANAAKSDFLSRMSHEIRTPMNAIIGMSAIAARSIGDDEQVADCISKIGISSRFLLSLINDILDMSRIESGKMLLKKEKIPTEEFLAEINSICYTQAAAKDVEYECIVDPVMDDYYIGDAMKLQQVLINILSNAIKFSREGGKVTFSASQRKKTKNDAVLRFIVNDTGVGMSEEFLPHIFEPFSQEFTGTTALYGGTGLGLAISKSIVDMMDGRIAVRSIKGIGSEFTVDVKLGITEEEKLRHNQKKHAAHFTHLKTLVVDDDVAVCESTVATLKEMGVTAEWVDSGRKAVDRVKDLWDNKKYYDMILIDWKMPGMDGIETAKKIRGIVGPEVTIIIMTAYDWASIEHEAKLAGVNLLMSKPMFKSTLVSAFTKALGEKEEDTAQQDIVNYRFSGKRVLLVEDNQINTEVAKMLLEDRGFAVDTAENGLRAMEVFSKSEDGYYDAILMDIRMPLMDGLTAAANIRHLSNKDARTIPIIAMTANAFDDDIAKSKAAGMNAHLAKPIEPDRLYQTLFDFIYGKEAGADAGV